MAAHPLGPTASCAPSGFPAARLQGLLFSAREVGTGQPQVANRGCPLVFHRVQFFLPYSSTIGSQLADCTATMHHAPLVFSPVPSSSCGRGLPHSYKACSSSQDKGYPFREFPNYLFHHHLQAHVVFLPGGTVPSMVETSKQGVDFISRHLLAQSPISPSTSITSSPKITAPLLAFPGHGGHDTRITPMPAFGTIGRFKGALRRIASGGH